MGSWRSGVHPGASRDDLADDVAVDVGEAEVAARVAVGEAFVEKRVRLQLAD